MQQKPKETLWHYIQYDGRFQGEMDAVIVAVSHKQFLTLDKEKISSLYSKAHAKKVLVDIKGIFDRKNIAQRTIFTGDCNCT